MYQVRADERNEVLAQGLTSEEAVKFRRDRITAGADPDDLVVELMPEGAQSPAPKPASEKPPAPTGEALV